MAKKAHTSESRSYCVGINENSSETYTTASPEHDESPRLARLIDIWAKLGGRINPMRLRSSPPSRDNDAAVSLTAVPFNPELHDIGAEIGCPRFPIEDDHEYAHRLAMRITQELDEREQLLERIRNAIVE